MGGGKYSDVFAAWPTAEISFMDPEPGINVVYNLRKEDNPERFEKILGHMTRDTEPWDAAGIFGVHDIIDPAETRDYLIRMLDMHRDRLHGNIGRRLLHAWPTSY
jgi:acetyl-CoA carboxylase carboxyltransferase component